MLLYLSCTLPHLSLRLCVTSLFSPILCLKSTFRWQHLLPERRRKLPSEENDGSYFSAAFVKTHRAYVCHSFRGCLRCTPLHALLLCSFVRHQAFAHAHGCCGSDQHGAYRLVCLIKSGGKAKKNGTARAAYPLSRARAWRGWIFAVLPAKFSNARQRLGTLAPRCCAPAALPVVPWRRMPCWTDIGGIFLL